MNCFHKKITTKKREYHMYQFQSEDSIEALSKTFLEKRIEEIKNFIDQCQEKQKNVPSITLKNLELNQQMIDQISSSK